MSRVVGHSYAQANRARHKHIIASIAGSIVREAEIMQFIQKKPPAQAAPDPAKIAEREAILSELGIRGALAQGGVYKIERPGGKTHTVTGATEFGFLVIDGFNDLVHPQVVQKWLQEAAKAAAKKKK